VDDFREKETATGNLQQPYPPENVFFVKQIEETRRGETMYDFFAYVQRTVVR